MSETEDRLKEAGSMVWALFKPVVVTGISLLMLLMWCLMGIHGTMLVDYCDRVQTVQNRPVVSSVIQKCISYISIHLHEPVSLEQLSRHCGLCGRSLSLRFKKEMGMGIPEYIHREKLQEAEYLLRHSGYSLSEITSFLNYPSQSYFTQIFKKYKNLTPQQFRDSKA